MVALAAQSGVPGRLPRQTNHGLLAPSRTGVSRRPANPPRFHPPAGGVRAMTTNQERPDRRVPPVRAPTRAPHPETVSCETPRPLPLRLDCISTTPGVLLLTSQPHEELQAEPPPSRGPWSTRSPAISDDESTAPDASESRPPALLPRRSGATQSPHAELGTDLLAVETICESWAAGTVRQYPFAWRSESRGARGRVGRRPEPGVGITASA
jgi:hypothetical protein